MLRYLIAAAVLLLMPSIAPAGVLLTFTGTIKSSYLQEYAVGSTFSIYFELAPFDPPTGYAPGNYTYQWMQETETAPSLYSTVRFTGSTGTWERPSGGDNMSGLLLFLNGEVLAETVFNDVPAPPTAFMGLYLGGEPVIGVYADSTFDFSPFSFSMASFTTTLPSVLDYWSQYDGYTFPVIGDPIDSYVSTNSGDLVISLSSMTVGVPEPSTVALLAASTIIGVILLKRRRSAA